MSSWKKIYTEKDIENTPTNNSTKLVTASGLNTALNSKSPSVHQHSSSKITDLINIIYPVGSIYLSTEDVNPNTLFPNTFWDKIEDRFLFASSDVTGYNNGDTGGSKDASIIAHTHTQNSHTHTANSHGHSFGDWYAPTISSSQNWGYFGPKDVNTVSGNTYYYPRSTANGGGIGETNVTANQTVTTNNTTATNQETGVISTDRNMPPYLVVNIWERKEYGVIPIAKYVSQYQNIYRVEFNFINENPSHKYYAKSVNPNNPNQFAFGELTNNATLSAFIYEHNNLTIYDTDKTTIVYEMPISNIPLSED